MVCTGTRRTAVCMTLFQTSAGAPPPVFGFGIARPAHVRAALAAGAAGVICGSAIVARIAAGAPVAPFVQEMKAATLCCGAAIG